MLQKHLGELMARYRRTIRPVEDVRIIELNRLQYDDRARPILDASAFRAPAEYESQFVNLMNSGYAWLNLSYLGTLNGRDIVGIETPGAAVESTGNTVASVNYSGPPKMVADAGGDASGYFVVSGKVE